MRNWSNWSDEKGLICLDKFAIIVIDNWRLEALDQKTNL